MDLGQGGDGGQPGRDPGEDGDGDVGGGGGVLRGAGSQYGGAHGGVVAVGLLPHGRGRTVVVGDQ